MSDHDMQDVRLVDVLSDLLRRYQVLNVLSKDGKGSPEGPATFQLFGRGPSNRQILLDVFLRLLVASENFQSPLHLCRTYKLKRDKLGNPKLVHGYTIAGSCANAEEVEELMKALDLEDWFTEKSSVNEALFFVPSPDGKGVMPSGYRNVPTSGASSPDGTRGVWPTRGPGGR